MWLQQIRNPSRPRLGWKSNRRGRAQCPLPPEAPPWEDCCPAPRWRTAAARGAATPRQLQRMWRACWAPWLEPAAGPAPHHRCPPPLPEPPLILHTARAAGLLHGCWQCWVPQGLVRCRPGQCCGGGGRRGAGSTCGVAGSMPLRSAKSSMKRAESQVLCNVSGSRIGSSLVPATRSWWLWWSVVCQEGGPWLRPSHSMRAARAWFSLRMASSRRHPWSLPQKEGAHLWQPPEEQKGDGRTALNDKFGY